MAKVEINGESQDKWRVSSNKWREPRLKGENREENRRDSLN